MVRWLDEHHFDRRLIGVGHRVVHGGADFVAPQLVSGEIVAALHGLVRIDPLHLPQAIDAIEALRDAFPDLPQVTCFDTAFHRTMPEVARAYPIPRAYRDEGVVRYGFHGLSYEYILDRLRAEDAAVAKTRIVVAHLGNGASMAAIEGGRSVDTTMGFTPTGGLVMGTRTGDLDPGLMLYFLEGRGMTAAQLAELVNARSGLLGVSGSTSDMQELLERRRTDPEAALAVELFCYTARKYLGALSAVLGGLDTLVFTGGIGEHAYQVRAEICRGLDFMGVRLDPALNRAGAPIISDATGTVAVRVMATDEDAMIAAHTRRVLGKRGEARVSI
jgi:acetate kinase